MGAEAFKKIVGYLTNPAADDGKVAEDVAVVRESDANEEEAAEHANQFIVTLSDISEFQQIAQVFRQFEFKMFLIFP